MTDDDRPWPSGGPFTSERDVAKRLGIARSVLWRAKQVAAIPEEEFEALIERDDPQR